MWHIYKEGNWYKNMGNLKTKGIILFIVGIILFSSHPAWVYCAKSETYLIARRVQNVSPSLDNDYWSMLGAIERRKEIERIAARFSQIDMFDLIEIDKLIQAGLVVNGITPLVIERALEIFQKIDKLNDYIFGVEKNSRTQHITFTFQGDHPTVVAEANTLNGNITFLFSLSMDEVLTADDVIRDLVDLYVHEDGHFKTVITFDYFSIELETIKNLFDGTWEHSVLSVMQPGKINVSDFIDTSPGQVSLFNGTDLERVSFVVLIKELLTDAMLLEIYGDSYGISYSTEYKDCAEKLIVAMRNVLSRGIVLDSSNVIQIVRSNIEIELRLRCVFLDEQRASQIHDLNLEMIDAVANAESIQEDSFQHQLKSVYDKTISELISLFEIVKLRPEIKHKLEDCNAQTMIEEIKQLLSQ